MEAAVFRLVSRCFRCSSSPRADSLTRKSCCRLNASAVFSIMTFWLIKPINSIPVIIRAVVAQIIIEAEGFSFILSFDKKLIRIKEALYKYLKIILIKKELKINEIRGGCFDTCGGNV